MSDATATATVQLPAAATGDPKRSRRPATRPGPALHASNSETKRLATAILEVLAGVRTPADAAKTLGISLSRYYLLEQRALAGLLAACEPRAKGPPRSVDRAIAQLQRELASSQRECARQSRRAGTRARGAARRRAGPAATAESDAEKRREQNASPSSDRAGVACGAGHRAELVWDE